MCRAARRGRTVAKHHPASPSSPAGQKVIPGDDPAVVVDERGVVVVVAPGRGTVVAGAGAVVLVVLPRLAG